MSVGGWGGESVNSQKHHYLRVFMCLYVCERKKKTVGLVGGRGEEREGHAERICSTNSLRNRSRSLPACVATCQNLSS